jgi:hypothetical protein
MLDNLIESDTVDFIKIDVEGAELGVLRGSKRIIEACRPLIMFESGFGSARNSVSSRESIWDFFDERGYQIVVPNRLAHEDSGLSRAGFVESHVYPRRTTNYFAVPEERRGEFRDRAQAALCSTAFLSKNARKQFTRQSKVSPPSSSTGA